jgi:hypothetical protein
VGWPRAGTGYGPGHLVVANSICWVDALALRTVVPGLSAARPPAVAARVAGVLRAGRTVTIRSERTTAPGPELGHFGPALLQAAVDAGAPVCPVAVRYRVDGGTGSALAASLAGEPLWRSLSRVVATRGLVVEVHLLPALHPSGADHREPAARAAMAGSTSPMADTQPRLG